jgi:hypothetical protein
MPTSKEARVKNDVVKEDLYRHQKRNERKMKPPKRIYTDIKRGTSGK